MPAKGSLVKLTALEIDLARYVAEQRQSGRVKAGVERDRYTHSGSKAVDLHTLGCEGEIAFAKWSGRYWSGAGLDKADDDDVMGVQVRTRSVSTYDLCVWPKDLRRHPDARFVLVTKETAKDFCIRGWIHSKDIARPEWFRQISKAPPSYFVPQSELRPCRRRAG